MTIDYNDKLAQDYEVISDKVRRGAMSMEDRIEASDIAVSEYVIAREAHLMSLRNPPIAYRDEYALHRFADIVLHEDLTWSHPDKMSIVEYPVMSERQRKRRFREIPSNVYYKEGDFSGHRKTYHEGDTDVAGKVGRKPVYDATNDVKASEYDTGIDVLELLERADLTDRQREAIELVFFDDMTQAQVGAVMGVNQDVISRRIDAALSKLRSILPKDTIF